MSSLPLLCLLALTPAGINTDATPTPLLPWENIEGIEIVSDTYEQFDGVNTRIDIR